MLRAVFHNVWVFFALCLVLAFFAQAQPSLSRAAVNTREYLPGDFVHIVVDAPPDTAQVTAVMPDGTAISLVQQRISGLWLGIWQVPVKFAKGTYSAKLSAVDVSGNVFEGYSDSFTVSELAMIALARKATREVAATALLSEKITLEAPAAAIEEQEIMKIIRKLIAQPAPGPAPKLKPSEKTALVERNLELGKESLSRGRAADAANYFRIVLYLAPDNKIAGSYLAEAQTKIAAEKSRRKQLLVFAVAGSVIGISLLFLLFRLILARPAPVPAAGAPKVGVKSEPSLEDKEKNWRLTMGWKENPFTFDIPERLFTNNNRLELEGFRNFIKARIESVGGQGALPFTDSALEKVYALSKGKPKEAVKICRWAVAQSIKQDKKEITAELIKEFEMGLKKIILIADDEEIIRASLGAILKNGGGYQTDFAVDGEETIRKIKSNLYGLVLLDIAMPKLDGYEILKQAREIYPDLPIVFVTGKGVFPKTIESLSQHNLTGYVEKPFAPEKILDMVARVLKIK